MLTIASHLRFSTRLATRALHQCTPLCGKAVAEATAKRIARRMKTKYGQWKPTKPTGKDRPNRDVRLAVILTEDVEGVGLKGEYILPKRKFARHELLWKNRAIYATPDNIIRYKIPDEVIDDQRLKLAIDESALLKKFFEEHDTITIEQDTSEKNWVLWEQDISAQLRDQLQLHVPLHCIEQADLPINSLGVHEIHIKLNVTDVVKMNIEVIKYVEKISDEKFKEELRKAIKEI